jgi:outer membrane biosynthesis protein TonB
MLRRYHVKEEVQNTKLVHKVPVMNPPLLGRRVDGTVVLEVVVGPDGAVKSATYISGPEDCAPYAIKSVQQWRYRPTLVSGVPIELDTKVSVVFPPPGE